MFPLGFVSSNSLGEGFLWGDWERESFGMKIRINLSNKKISNLWLYATQSVCLDGCRKKVIKVNLASFANIYPAFSFEFALLHESSKWKGGRSDGAATRQAPREQGGCWSSRAQVVDRKNSFSEVGPIIYILGQSRTSGPTTKGQYLPSLDTIKRGFI